MHSANKKNPLWYTKSKTTNEYPRTMTSRARTMKMSEVFGNDLR